MDEMTEDELARLSPEERAALAGDEDERTTLQGIVEDIDDGEDGDDDDDKGKTGTADDTDAQGAAAGTAAGTATDDDDDDDERPFVPVYQAAADDTDAKIAELDGQRSAIVQAFRDGDKSVDEMEAELKEIDQQRNKLVEQKVKASVFEDMAKQQADQQWQWEISRFMKTVKRNEGIDYRDEANKHLNKSLDHAVKLLASDPDNADKDGEWFLEEAHRITKARFNLGKPDAGKPDGGKPGGGKPAAASARRPDLKSVPVALSQVPNAGQDDSDTGDGEFAYLDKLSGMDLENELARMSPAKQERYLRSA